MGTLRIRKALIDEVEIIAKVISSAFAEFESLYTPRAFAATTPRPEELRERFDEGPVWVAFDNNEMVGTVAAVAEDKGIYIRSMAVDPKARGGGIGRKLLEEVEKFAAEKKRGRLFLGTTPFLLSAIRLYEKSGFERAGDEDLCGTPLIAMEKRLAEDY